MFTFIGGIICGALLIIVLACLSAASHADDLEGLDNIPGPEDPEKWM